MPKNGKTTSKDTEETVSIPPESPAEDKPKRHAQSKQTKQRHYSPTAICSWFFRKLRAQSSQKSNLAIAILQTISGIGCISVIWIFPGICNVTFYPLNSLTTHTLLALPLIFFGIIGIIASIRRKKRLCRLYFFGSAIGVVPSTNLFMTLFQLRCSCNNFLQCLAIAEFETPGNGRFVNPFPAPEGIRKYSHLVNVPWMLPPDTTGYVSPFDQEEDSSSFVEKEGGPQPFENGKNISTVQFDWKPTNSISPARAEKQLRTSSVSVAKGWSRQFDAKATLASTTVAMREPRKKDQSSKACKGNQKYEGDAVSTSPTRAQGQTGKESCSIPRGRSYKMDRPLHTLSMEIDYDHSALLQNIQVTTQKIAVHESELVSKVPRHKNRTKLESTIERLWNVTASAPFGKEHTGQGERYGAVPNIPTSFNTVYTHSKDPLTKENLEMGSDKEEMRFEGNATRARERRHSVAKEYTSEELIREPRKIYKLQNTTQIWLESGDASCSNKTIPGDKHLGDRIRACREDKDACPSQITSKMIECGLRSNCDGIRIRLIYLWSKVNLSLSNDKGKGYQEQWNVELCLLMSPLASSIKNFQDEDYIFFEKNPHLWMSPAQTQQWAPIFIDDQEDLPRKEWISTMLDRRDNECNCDPTTDSCKVYEREQDRKHTTSRHNSKLGYWCFLADSEERQCENKIKMKRSPNKKLWTEGVCKSCQCAVGLGDRIGGADLRKAKREVQDHAAEKELKEALIGHKCDKWFNDDELPWCIVGWDSTCADREAIIIDGIQKLRLYRSSLPCLTQRLQQLEDKPRQRCRFLRTVLQAVEVIRILVFIPALFIISQFMKDRCEDYAHLRGSKDKDHNFKYEDDDEFPKNEDFRFIFNDSSDGSWCSDNSSAASGSGSDVSDSGSGKGSSDPEDDAGGAKSKGKTTKKTKKGDKK